VIKRKEMDMKHPEVNAECHIIQDKVCLKLSRERRGRKIP
jgi:hypothetical protein